VKLTLKQKREIVEKFLDGEGVASLALTMAQRAKIKMHYSDILKVEQVLREYYDAKFALKGGRKK